MLTTGVIFSIFDIHTTQAFIELFRKSTPDISSPVITYNSLSLRVLSKYPSVGYILGGVISFLIFRDKKDAKLKKLDVSK